MNTLRLMSPCLLGVALAFALPSPAHAQAQEQAPASTSTVHSAAFEVGREQESVTATVTQIDKKSRFVTLRGPRGNEVTIEAGPDVRNFDQLHVGDQVTATYQAAAALEILPADSGPAAIETSGDATRTPLGSKPGMTSEQAVSVTSKLTALDMEKHTVTLTGPDGKQRVIAVKDPSRQARMSKLKVGQMVRVTYVEAIAVEVTPKGKATP